MKFRITLKDPDGIYDCVSDAVDDGRPLGVTDSEWREIRDARIREITHSKWIEFGDYITVEIDTDAGTAVVVPVGR